MKTHTSCLRVVLLCLLLVSAVTSFAQNMSNKGKDFWLGYMAHFEGTASGMNLYVTSDRSTTVTVTVGNNTPTTHQILANQATVIPISPYSALISSSEVIEQKAIHVTSDLPVVVYAHIYFLNKSGATLVLPSNTLGRSYYAMSYEQYEPFGYYNQATSQLMVVALEDNTTVEITPTATTLNGRPAGVPFSPERPLNKGEVYQVRSRQDLTGSKVESIDAGVGSCKRIAVFSGSSYTAIPLNCPGIVSGDNLYQQLYPISAWGKNFVTAPFQTRLQGDVYRALASKDNTSIAVNGRTVTRNKGEYYEFESQTANYISATEPILLAQFAKTQACDNVTGDPEMTLINPVEQTLTDITLYSSRYYQISRHFINVTMQAKDTASFRLDGSRVPFKSVASNPAYVYSQNTVQAGNHTLTADSGFNAVAYGFGEVESYGYAAGANIRSLNQNITVLSDSICDGRNIRFKGYAVYQPLAWKWDFGDGTTSNVQNPSHVFPSVGTYTVSLVTTKANGNDCDSQDSTYIEVEVHPNPEANFSYNTLCSNDSTRFQDLSQVTTGETIESWHWNFGDGTTSTRQNPGHRFTNAGTYQVQLVITTKALCTDTITKSITVFAPPVAKFSAGAVCDKESMVFQNQSTVAVGQIVQWEWDFGDGSARNTENQPSHVYAQPGTYLVKLKVTSDQSCTDSTQMRVTSHPKPVAEFTLPDICQRDVAAFQNLSTVSTGTLSYAWQFGDGGTSTAQHPQHRYQAAGDYTVKLIITSATGCRDSVSHTYTVSGAVPVPQFTAASFCQKDSVHFTDASQIDFGKILRWNWSFGDGTSSTDQNPVHHYTAPGTYQVTLSIWSGIVCTESITKSITVVPNPVAEFSTVNVCGSESARFVNNTSANGAGTLTYLWNFGDGKTSTEQSPAHLYAAPGTYTVTLSAQGANTCGSVISKSITVYPSPIADFSPTVGCLADAVTFQDMSSLAGGTLVKWAWNFGDGSTSTLQHPTHTYTRAGTFTVSLQVTSDLGCSHTISKTVTISPTPFAQAGPDQLLCGLTATQLAANAPGPATGLWTVVQGAGGSFSDASNPRARFSGNMKETYVLRWTVSNSPCASVADDVQISFKPTPAVEAGNEVLLIEGESTTLAGSGEGTLTWTPSIGLSNPSIGNPVASPLVTTTYYLHVTSIDGCPSVDSVQIEVKKRLQIPKAFSPNGDGTNDTWEIPNMEEYPQVLVEVYNRWGEKVYSTIGYPTPWDGKRNGNDLPVGAYYYIIDPHNGRPKLSGSVTILR